jgi:hypothetical protein
VDGVLVIIGGRVVAGPAQSSCKKVYISGPPKFEDLNIFFSSLNYKLLVK